MRTRSVVNNELNDVEEFSRLVRHALKDILNKHAHDLLSFLMGSFNEALLYRSPWGAKSASQPYQGTVLVHQGVLELGASIATKERRKTA